MHFVLKYWHHLLLFKMPLNHLIFQMVSIVSAVNNMILEYGEQNSTQKLLKIFIEKIYLYVNLRLTPSLIFFVIDVT